MSEDFLNNFKKKYGRPLRVLHIGNIANNAYTNSKIMQKAGVDSVVLCNDYYHIMACPEWEECELLSTPDHTFPVWVKSLKNSYSRPIWFVQGPIRYCLQYLQDYFSKSENTKKNEHLKLQKIVEALSLNGGRYVDKFYGLLSIIGFVFIRAPFFMTNLTFEERSNYILSRLPLLKKGQELQISGSVKGMRRFFLTVFVNCVLAVLYLYKAYCSVYHAMNRLFKFYDFDRDTHDQANNLLIKLNEYREFLTKNLSANMSNAESDEIAKFLSYRDLKAFKKVIDQFDIVQGYAYDGIWPLILGFRPYVAYEHGTIRTLPFDNNMQGQITKLAYANAAHVVITNADNVVAAKKLELKNYDFIPHPIYEIDYSDLDLVSSPVNLATDTFYIFAPARHQWDEDLTKDGGMQKGNHYIIHAFSEFLKLNSSSQLIFVNYGIDVEKSKNLIRKLNLEKKVIWIEPVEVKRLVKLMVGVDVIIDQFQLGAFGGIPPRALSLKKPLITMYNEDLHNWCFKEHPPFFRASSSSEILSHLKNIYSDHAHRDDYVKRGFEWYQKYHSNKLILDSHLKIYERILSDLDKI